ncbi:MAG: cytochrome c [Proteobacteria bacterium]|nr:cytochrome c [Pseudomonadota bacterium]
MTLCAFAGVASAQTHPTGAEVASIGRGRVLAEENCARCHAIGESGESTHPGAPAFRTLSSRYPVADIAEAFAEGVRVGHPDMPEFQFQPRQIDDLINYLQSIQRPQH